MTIAGIPYIGWDGEMRPGQRRSRPVETEPGVTGGAIGYDAWQPEPSEIATWHEQPGPLGSVDALVDRMRALHGPDPIVVIDPYGRTWTGCLVDLARHEWTRLTLSGLYRIEMRWRFLSPVRVPLT